MKMFPPSACRKSPAGAGLFLIDMVEWARVMQDAGTRENGSRSGRVRSHRPTGAEGAFAIVSLVPKWMRRTVTMEKLQLYSLSP